MSGLRDALADGPKVLETFGIPVISGAPGASVSIGGYFDKKRFVYPFYWAIEDRGLLAGGIGPDIVAGACARPIRNSRPLLAEKFLHPLRPLLVMSRHEGWIEVACTIGYDGDSVASGATTDPVSAPALGQVFGGAGGIVDENLAHRFGFLAQLRLYLPEGQPLTDWGLGMGKSSKEAYARAREHAESLGIPDLCYRIDCGTGIKSDLELLEESGWLR